MEVNQVKQKIGLAMEAVQDVPEPFKLKAFEVVLSNSLASSANTLLSSETKSTNNHGLVSIESKVEKIAGIIKLEKELIKDAIDFGEDEPSFIATVDGSETERQVQISRSILFVMDHAYGREWVKSSFLLRKLQDCGVGSLQHLNENLEARKTDFRSRGKKKGTEYKLTQPGQQNAIAFIRELAAS